VLEKPDGDEAFTNVSREKAQDGRQ
jgi:hypothetical protein